MNDNKKRDIFYGVVAIATLIVALVGATLAYFSISVSSNEGAVNAQAAVVSIEYQDGQQVSIQATELIPSAFEYVKTSYETYVKDSAVIDPENLETESPKCIDSNSRQICSTYRFSIGNDTGKALTATLNAEHNGFQTQSLSFGVYDLVAGRWLTLQTSDTGVTSEFLTFSDADSACDNTNENGEDDCFTADATGLKTYRNSATKSIFGYTTTNGVTTANTMNASEQRYELVLFINETNKDQNVDQGKSFQGTITISLAEGSEQITGCIGDNCKQ